MSTSRIDYIVVGIKAHCKTLPENFVDDYDIYADDFGQSKVTEHCGLTMIYDGMHEEYCIIGKVVSKAVEEWGDYTEMTNVRAAWHLYMQQTKQNIRKHFPMFINLPVSVYAFTHHA